MTITSVSSLSGLVTVSVSVTSIMPSLFETNCPDNSILAGEKMHAELTSTSKMNLKLQQGNKGSSVCSTVLDLFQC